MTRDTTKTQHDADLDEYDRLADIVSGCRDDDYRFPEPDMQTAWEEMMGFDSLDDLDDHEMHEYECYAGGFDIIAGAFPLTGDDECDATEKPDECDHLPDPPKCVDCTDGWVILFDTRAMCDTCGGSGY